MGKLTDQQRADIYQAWKDGTAQKDLAKQYGVCYQAINQLINKMNAKKPAPAELEDVENGIPNTPLLPQKKERKAAQINQEFDAAVTEMIENADKNTAIAEKNSENAAPEKLPDFVMDAVDNELNCVELDIEAHEERIADLQEELRTLEAKRQKLADWLEAHT